MKHLTGEYFNPMIINSRLLVKIFLRAGVDKNASAFFRMNGKDALITLARVIRIRAARGEIDFSGILRHQVNRIDPPPCRCGKKGTRIIGHVTFCLTCGPPADAQSRKNYITRELDNARGVMEVDRKAKDYHDLKKHLTSSQQWK